MTDRISPAEAGRYHDSEAITAVPTEDIARWIARVNLINYALEQNQSVHVGGMADDGIMYDYMVREAEKGVDWRMMPAFESAIIYEMKPSIGYRKVVEAPNRYVNHPQHGEGKNISMDITRGALRVGLGRVGLYGPDAPHVPVEAMAALHYMKGNIKDPIDRKLNERSSEIDEGVLAISSVVNARTTVRQVLRPVEGEWVKEYREVPVYLMARSGMEPEKVRALGLNPDSPIDPWWQELSSDMARIDEVTVNAVRQT